MTPIFEGIEPAKVEQMMKCFSAVTRKFKTGSIILNYSGGLEHICVVQSGCVEINSTDSEGNEHVVETLSANSVFGELFSLPMDSMVYTAAAKTPCEILFIRYSCAIHTCEKLCPHHHQLIHNLFRLSAEKAQQLSKRIAMLSQRTLRRKLMLYLEYLAREKNTNSFELPISLSELAEYLSADRSALMRELSRMREDHLICSSGRHFEILN